MGNIFISTLKDLKKKFYTIPIDIVYIFLSVFAFIFSLRKITQHMNNLYNIAPEIESLQEYNSLDPATIQPIVDSLNHELNFIYMYFLLCILLLFACFIIFQSVQLSLSYYNIKEFKASYFDYLKRFIFIAGFFALFFVPILYYLFNSTTWVIESLGIYSILLFMFILIIGTIIEYLAIYTAIFSLEHPFKQVINTIILLSKNLKLFLGYLFVKFLILLAFIIDFVMAWLWIDNYVISAIILIVLLGIILSFGRFFLIHLALDKKI